MLYIIMLESRNVNSYFRIRQYRKHFEQLKDLAFKYWDSLPRQQINGDGFATFLGDSEQSMVLRNKIVRLLPYVNEAAEKLNISHNLISSFKQQPNVQVNLYKAIIDPEQGYRPIPKIKITDALELSLSACKKHEREALIHLLCPWNWLIDGCALIIRLPFLILRRAGLPPQIEENIISQIIKVLSVIAIIAVATYKGLKVDLNELLKYFKF